MEPLTVAYYGYVTDASGYGHTARAYIHALHRAGVELSVTDLSRRRARPADALVASLLERRTNPHLHLFHGIPPQWARLAFPVRAAVGMTVWETDAMPSQWRSALNHVQDVWLPCAFNVEVFQRELERPVFRLPHPVFPPHANGDATDPGPFLDVADDEFVFYALFAWQERKGPRETLDAYLSAFGAGDRAVLLLKVDAGSVEAARRAVDEARARHRSDARVVVRAENWGEGGIEALHRRGDCYVSLHRGEGWGYPLFEAACRGKPVVATAYSGPLDYLDPDAHAMVRCTLVPVRQPYVYYTPRMRWAEPDTAHAAERMREVFDGRDAARTKAAAAAERIRAAFSLEAVGAAARDRLGEVLQRMDGARRRPGRSAVREAPAPAPLP
ncbi:MAG TPA: glycosyltransferase, partial [Longimicrobium sp.]|nr:glycosyltransferase [Longimicrobium sp.]